jgi:hypothetical protein
MFNGLIDSTQVQLGKGSSSKSSGGRTRRCRTEQDIMNEKMEKRLSENEEYNLYVQEYYRHQDTTFAQQQVALQVSMIVNNQFLMNQTLNNLYY